MPSKVPRMPSSLRTCRPTCACRPLGAIDPLDGSQTHTRAVAEAAVAEGGAAEPADVAGAQASNPVRSCLPCATGKHVDIGVKRVLILASGPAPIVPGVVTTVGCALLEVRLLS